MGNYKDQAGVYIIMCAPNQKRYIGCCKTRIKKRFANHKYKLRMGTHPSRDLQADWDLHGEDKFSFAILEDLQLGHDDAFYNQKEEKWILDTGCFLEGLGYNKTLPGTKVLPKDIEGINKIDRSNNDRSKAIPCICIDSATGKIVRVESYKEASEITGCLLKKVYDFVSYWKGNGKRSHNGWLIVKEGEYDNSFDYINFNKRKKLTSPKTWRDYDSSRKTPRRKNIETIIPYEERNIKRCPIVAVNMNTGEETLFPSLKSVEEKFMLAKVRKCINADFKKYKHRDHYFRKAS